MSVDSELFDAGFLERLRTLFFKLRKRRKLKRRSAQPTLSSGLTREFKDYRHYAARLRELREGGSERLLSTSRG